MSVNHSVIQKKSDAHTCPLAVMTATIGLVALTVQPAAAITPNDGDAANTLVVTGIRASLDSAAKAKRSASLILDSVSAEDIGKLPDVSIADSLARLPGLTAQRIEGRDQRLSIRGFGPDFSTTLLNGREQVTVGDNRGVEYDQYPSEFFQRVDVYKSADAGLIAAGVAGTVDLRMLRPLDLDKPVVALSIRAHRNGKRKLNPDAERTGYRASLAYVDQFSDERIGLSVGFAASKKPSQDERFESWGYPTDANGNLIMGGVKPYAQSNLIKRYGTVATLEWRPNEDVHSTFDLLASRFEETQRLRGLEFPLFWGVDVSVTDAQVKDGFVTGATFNNVYGVQRNDYNKRDASTLSLGWNNEIRLADRLILSLDASWSQAKRTDFLLETYSGTGYMRSGVADALRVERQGDGFFRLTPALDYSEASLVSLTDPNGWGYNGTSAMVQAGFLNRPKFIDDMKSLRADLTGEFERGLLRQWKVGANYSGRRKRSAFTSYFLCPAGSGVGCRVESGAALSAPVPQSAILPSKVSLRYLGGRELLTLNPLSLYAEALSPVFDNRPSSLARDYVVKEDILTGYAMLTMAGEISGAPFTSAIGLQLVHSRQASAGTLSSFAANDGAPELTVIPVTGSARYTDILPSWRMTMEVAPDMFVKLSASATMSRPRLDQERVNQEFSVDLSKVGSGSDPQFSPFSSKGGNAALRPYRSKNIDLSVERYFSGGGYFSVAPYFKKLTDFVDPNNNIAFDFMAAVSALPTAAQAIVRQQGSSLGLLTAPANSGKGRIIGVEATASLPLKFFTPALEGFGVIFSSTYADSKIGYRSNPGVNISLPGLSKLVMSGTAYFEKNGFQARASYRYRSPFLGEMAGLSAAPTFRTIRQESILDAQLGYEFCSGPLMGLSILLQGKNLTNRPFVTYQNDDERQVTDYQSYGPDFYFGLAYKF